MRDSQTASLMAMLGRIIWMMVGPMAVAVSAFLVASKGGGWFTAADLTYLVALAVTMSGRSLEMLGGHPLKATGEPATAADLRNYFIATTVIGLVVWVIANLLGNQ